MGTSTTTQKKKKKREAVMTAQKWYADGTVSFFLFSISDKCTYYKVRHDLNVKKRSSRKRVFQKEFKYPPTYAAYKILTLHA